MKKVFTGLVLMASAILPVQAAGEVDLARAEEIVSGRCFLCHGLEGEAASAVFPRLAGQHWEYTTKQLSEFKSGKRKSDTMQPQAEDLTPEEMKAIGVYFEGKQVPGREVADEELHAVGKFIYHRGNQFSGLPSCASCHGVKGHGTPQLPRLA
ncbi:MAG: cytochrome c, partial [Azonexus sp.]|nr:cytochrome c [Azonexus sp.]